MKTMFLVLFLLFSTAAFGQSVPKEAVANLTMASVASGITVMTINAYSPPDRQMKMDLFVMASVFLIVLVEILSEETADDQ